MTMPTIITNKRPSNIKWRIKNGMFDIAEVPPGVDIKVLEEIITDDKFHGFPKGLGVQVYQHPSDEPEKYKLLNDLKQMRGAFRGLSMHANGEVMRGIVGYFHTIDAYRLLYEFHAQNIDNVILNYTEDLNPGSQFDPKVVYDFARQLSESKVSVQLEHLPGTTELIRLGGNKRYMTDGKLPYGKRVFPGTFDSSKDKWAEYIAEIDADKTRGKWQSIYMVGGIGAQNVGNALEMMATGLPADMPLKIHAHGPLLIPVDPNNPNGDKMFSPEEMYKYYMNIKTWISDAVGHPYTRRK